MWDMRFTGPTLFFLLFIAAEFFSKKKLPIRINNVFAWLLITDLLTMLLDYSSTRFDELHLTPDGTLWLFNYLFFAMFIARSCYFFMFPIALLSDRDSRSNVKPFTAIFIAEEIFLLIGSFNGWIFSVNDGFYSSGPLYQFINLQFFLWIAMAIVVTIKMESPVTVSKLGVFVYLTILLIGIVLRTLFPQLVIMNLFCLFAIFVIYMTYLNTEQYIDDVTRLFNNPGWNRLLSEASFGKGFGMVAFGIRNYTELLQLHGEQQLEPAMNEIGIWIRHNWPQMPSFYLGDGVFVLSSRNFFDQEFVTDEINSRFNYKWSSVDGDYYLGANVMMLDREIDVSDYELIRGAIGEAIHGINKIDSPSLINVDDEFIHRYERRREIHKLLLDAIKCDKLEMFLQPVVNAETGKVECAEALCRLSDGNGGYIFPDEFIPIAKNNGNMDLLGHQMFRKACEFMSREDVRWSGLMKVNVNVAPEQFRNPNLLREYMDILKEYDLEPDKVHLEVTEETMIDRSLLHDSMLKFRKKGFVFSMDDFGSSYSNMIRLQQNHFSEVKIDRDFTWSYFKEETALLPDIIKTCHDLGLKVIVEGVETAEMAAGIKAIHGDYIQGYYYSKPIPVSEFVDKFLN